MKYGMEIMFLRIVSNCVIFVIYSAKTAEMKAVCLLKRGVKKVRKIIRVKEFINEK